MCIFKNINSTGVYIYKLKMQGVYIVPIVFSGVYIKESKNWGTGKEMATLKTHIFTLFSLIKNVLFHLKYRAGTKIQILYDTWLKHK